MMDTTQAASWLDEHDIKWVKTEGISIDGLVIGKHLSTRKFVSALPLGNAITEFVLGYDIGGTPFLVWWDDWRRDALGDFHQRPDLSTLGRALPTSSATSSTSRAIRCRCAPGRSCDRSPSDSTATD